MGFWAWFWIWTGLISGSLVVYGLIAKSLFNRGLEVMHQLERIGRPAQALLAAVETKPTLEDLESDLLTPVAELDAERKAILKRKTQKQTARPRRLRTALKQIDVNESRFTND